MNQPVTHETLFSELMELSTNPRRRDSLNRVKKACDYLEQQGMKISLSAIERYCIDRDWGGRKLNRFKTLTFCAAMSSFANPRRRFRHVETPRHQSR